MKPAFAGRKPSCVLLIVAGIAALGAGIVIAVYSSAVLMPKISTVTREVQADLLAADGALAALDKSGGLLARSIESFEAQSELVAMLPETFAHMEGVLRSAANTSFVAGEVAKETGEGVAGLVLPDSETADSALALQRTSEQMQQLAGVIGELGGASEALATDLAGLSRELAASPPGSKSDTGRLTAARRHLRALQDGIADAELPTVAMLAGMTVAGLYIVIGTMCLALASGLSAPASGSP
jgi:hypothetical protein